jgi:ferredoxin
MQVWIDHDECVGVGTCADIAPSVFVMGDDGVAYVQQGGVAIRGRGSEAVATVPDDLLEDVIEAAESCPGECIYLEV